MKNKYLIGFLAIVIICSLLFVSGYIDKIYTLTKGNKIVLGDRVFDLRESCYQSMVFQRWYNSLVHDEGYLDTIRVTEDKCKSENCYFNIRIAKKHEIEALKTKDIGLNIAGHSWDNIHLLKEGDKNNMYYAANSQVLIFSSNSDLFSCITSMN